MKRPRGICYLIHFEEPFKHARHYVGFTERTIDERLAEHRSGSGARLLQVCNTNAVNYHAVRIWKNRTRRYERRLKIFGHFKLLCPKCNPERWRSRYAPKRRKKRNV